MSVAAFFATLLRGLPQPAEGKAVRRTSVDSRGSTERGSTPRVNFAVPAPVYRWLADMAIVHNCGSVHKSVRDLLVWASAGQDDDLEWMFATSHGMPTFADDAQAGSREPPPASNRAAHAANAAHAAGEGVALEARLSRSLQDWIATCVDHYALEGPSDVLDAICRCAIELDAADDVFQCDESTHHIGRSTVDLYHDLGINCFSSSTASGSPRYRQT